MGSLQQRGNRSDAITDEEYQEYLTICQSRLPRTAEEYYAWLLENGNKTMSQLIRKELDEYHRKQRLQQYSDKETPDDEDDWDSYVENVDEVFFYKWML